MKRSFLTFSVFYGGMVCVAGVLGNKQVSLGPLSALGPLIGLPPLAVEAGVVAFLLLVMLASAVAELHGRDAATALVRFGFAPLVAAIVLAEIVLALPAAPAMEPARRDAFTLMMGGTPRIWIAGILAYGISQTLNVAVFTSLSGRPGRLLWLRAGVAAVLSQAVDTLIFVTVAFWGVFPVGALLGGQMLAKVLLSAIAVPPLTAATVALGRWLDRKAGVVRTASPR
ncbi:MAG: queuosine precursor transporter [Sphingomonadaceae bacterium]|nr:queuosine precursor transporter [Sphingomonadaceae bacterium]